MIGRRLADRLVTSRRILTVGRSPGSDIALDLGADEPLDPGSTEADVMIHCASAFGSNSIEDSIQNELVNSAGCLRVAQLAALLRCLHLIYLSSISAHPKNSNATSYGLSKRHGRENLELACGVAGIGLTTLSIAQVYDELGDARKHQPLFYHILDCARTGRDFVLFGKNDPLRNLLFIEDLVTVIERVVCRRITGAYNVVHPTSYRISEIAQIAFDVFRAGGSVVRVPEKPDPVSVWYPHDASVFPAIDYEPETDLRSGINLIARRTPKLAVPANLT